MIANLGRLLEYLYPDLDPLRDYEVRDDGAGPHLGYWRAAGVERPTAEYLASRAAELESLHPRWRQRRAAKALADAGGPDQVLLRAILKVIRLSLAQTNQHLADLRAELVALGRNPPPAPQTRTYAQLVQAVKDAIDQGGGDPS